MRPAAKRSVRVVASSGFLALASAGAACWVSAIPMRHQAAALVLSRLLACLLFRLDRLYWRELTFRDSLTVALAIAGGSAIGGAAAVMSPEPWPGRVLVAELALHATFSFTVAGALRYANLRDATPIEGTERVLIWGSGSNGQRLLDFIRRSNRRFDPLGWLDDDPALAEIDRDGLAVLGPIESLPLLAELHPVQSVLVAVPSLSPERRTQAEDLAHWSGVKAGVHAQTPVEPGRRRSSNGIPSPTGSDGSSLTPPSAGRYNRRRRLAAEMAMLTTQASDRVFVSAVNTRNVIRSRIGPSECGPARWTEMAPSEARKVALFLLQTAEKVEAPNKGKSSG